MKFLICPCSKEQLEYDDGASFYQSVNGVAYNYMIDFTIPDMINIKDTCGRYMPVDVEEIDGMARMLTKIATYVKNKQTVDAMLLGELYHGAEV